MRHHLRIKITGILLTAILLAGLLSACSLAKNSTNTSITVTETGAITENIIEDKTGDFTAEELSAYVKEKVAAYNKGNEKDPTVEMESCTVDNGSVQLTMKYASCDDYAAFNNVVCFQGTLKEAEDAGYDVMNITWYEQNGAKGDEEVISGRIKEWKVFIISEPISLKLPDKILYTSENVKITGRLTAVVETVMNPSGETPKTTTVSSLQGSSQTDTDSGTGTAVKPALTPHPLATVAEQNAYVMYK
ncbi:MAG: hypothetical protein HUJ73_08220 [Eubacterium sp.]|nr:hypothetical protein [Eubacterium sp.]